jgi:uncharacterized damage-inducible protein DinB
VQTVRKFQEAFDHNYWARDRQLLACAGLSQDQFEKPLGNSFSSIRDTLVHLLAVEWVWLERWHGRSPRSKGDLDDLHTLAQVSKRWLTLEVEMRLFVRGLTEQDLEQPVTYVNFAGETWTYPLGSMITHLLLHQSYHRGQITTMLRQLGATPPTVDFLFGLDKGFRL